MKNYFGFQTRRTPNGGYSPGFLRLFALLLVPSAGIWWFYRWIFNNDTNLLALCFLVPVSAWIWAYLIGYGTANHIDEGRH